MTLRTANARNASLREIDPRFQPHAPAVDAADQAAPHLEIWVEWQGERAALRRQVAGAAALEQHTLLAIDDLGGRGLARDGQVRLRFDFVGRSPEEEAKTQALLRRLAPIARWTRVLRRGSAAPGRRAQPDIGAVWDHLAKRSAP